MDNEIISELSDAPKSLTVLHFSLRRKGVRKSIQALFKQLTKMTEKGELVREGKSYGLSKKWVLENKKFFDALYQKTARNNRKPLLLSDYEEYHFDTLFAMDNLWNDAIYRLIKESKDRKMFIKENYYWWFIINMGYEISMWLDLKRMGMELNFILIRDCPLNRWAIKVLRENGFKARIIESTGNEYTDYNIFDDTIIQANYDKKTEGTIKRIFKKYASIEKIPVRTLTALNTGKGKFTLKIIRNRPLADAIKNAIRLYRKKPY